MEHVFMDCVMCEEHKQITTTVNSTLHANCVRLQSITNEPPCVVESIYQGHMSAYRSIYPIPPENPKEWVLNIRKEEDGFRAYRHSDECVKFDQNMPRLIDWCNRLGFMHRLTFSPSENDSKRPTRHIFL